MKVKQIISENKNGNRREVIAKDTDGKCRTLHIHKEYSVWKYFVAKDKQERKVFAPITI